MNDYFKLPKDFNLEKVMDAETPEKRRELLLQSINRFKEIVATITQTSLENHIISIKEGLANAQKELSKNDPSTREQAEFQVQEYSTYLDIALKQVEERKAKGKWVDHE